VLLFSALAAGILAIVDAIDRAIWTMGGWLVVCLTCLVASQIAEKLKT
jgi:hypothetical protein